MSDKLETDQVLDQVLAENEAEEAYWASVGARPRKNPTPEQLQALAKSPRWCYFAAGLPDMTKKIRDVLEPIIATNAFYSKEYATVILHRRFILGEESISRNHWASEAYLKSFPEAKEDWVALCWVKPVDLDSPPDFEPYE